MKPVNVIYPSSRCVSSFTRASLSQNNPNLSIIQYFLLNKAIIWTSPFILSHISIFKAKHSLGSGGATLTRVRFHRGGLLFHMSVFIVVVVQFWQHAHAQAAKSNSTYKLDNINPSLCVCVVFLENVLHSKDPGWHMFIRSLRSQCRRKMMPHCVFINIIFPVPPTGQWDPSS